MVVSPPPLPPTVHSTPADSKINVPPGDEPLSLYRSNENLNVALRVAEEAGLQVVNIGATDIIQGRPASILGLTWQLIRVHLLAQINLKVTIRLVAVGHCFVVVMGFCAFGDVAIVGAFDSHSMSGSIR